MNINWNTPSGWLLDLLLDVLPKPTGSAKPIELTVFGSGVLQMALAVPDLTSGDVDVFSDDFELIRRIAEQHGLDADSRDPGIEVSHPGWRTAQGWERRVHIEIRKGHRLVFPDPLDILAAKLHRAEEKDLRGFKIVYNATGFPTEEELIERLKLAVDLYRPTFDEERGANMANNTRMLWNELYGHDIDVYEQIIRPALRRQMENWHQDVPDYRERARILAERLLEDS